LLLDQRLVRTPVRLQQGAVDMACDADALVVQAGGQQAGVSQVAARAQVALHGAQHDVLGWLVESVW
jgi:hypothetical protein